LGLGRGLAPPFPQKQQQRLKSRPSKTRGGCQPHPTPPHSTPASPHPPSHLHVLGDVGQHLIIPRRARRCVVLELGVLGGLAFEEGVVACGANARAMSTRKREDTCAGAEAAAGWLTGEGDEREGVAASDKGGSPRRLRGQPPSRLDYRPKRSDSGGTMTARQLYGIQTFQHRWISERSSRPRGCAAAPRTRRGCGHELWQDVVLRLELPDGLLNAWGSGPAG
jgi:hypothetical protein